jgi:hypothetical protein
MEIQKDMEAEIYLNFATLADKRSSQREVHAQSPKLQYRRKFVFNITVPFYNKQISTVVEIILLDISGCRPNYNTIANGV